MENASKALIIAGAILISILLIAVGMFIFNAAQSPIDEAGSQMDQTAMKMFNQKFEAYDGNQSGANVKALISTVITNNSKETGANGNVVKVTGGGKTNISDSATLSGMRSAIITSGKTYAVTITYGTNGLVTLISYV